MQHEENLKLANLLFPDVTETPEAVLARYPERQGVAGQCVTRYAPSPTGMMHIGGVYAALISKWVARQESGTFILRIEDTDKEREIENGVKIIAESLAKFGISIDEGVLPSGEEVGVYGPYKQSDRLPLYRVFLKELVARGFAYPCFCTSEELEEARMRQEQQKIRTGYYGAWAKHRSITAAEAEERVARGEKFVVRLRSQGVEGQKFQFKDGVRGMLTLTVNDQDTVLLKSDGYPTYHWAHIVDDKLMHTTQVVRGEEWLPSAPLHVEMFGLMGWDAPAYAHISVIMKIDGGNKRKLSKRKDPEASVTFYFSEGYPHESVTEYLLNLANSSFEDWRREHPEKPVEEFKLQLSKINASGALFDFVKLADISKNVISRMSADEVYARGREWASEHNPEFAKLLTDESDYAHAVFGIERSGDKRRKDIAKWSELPETVGFFFDSVFAALPETQFIPPEKIIRTDAAEILHKFLASYSPVDDMDTWFAKVKDVGASVGYAPDTKTFKADPGAFKGHIGDVAMVLRIALTKRAQTPDLYQMLTVMGEQRVRARVTRAIEVLTA